MLQAREKQNFARLGELEHVQLPDVRRRLEAAEAAVGRDGAHDVSNIVSMAAIAVVDAQSL